LLDEVGLAGALSLYVQGLGERGLTIKLDLPKILDRFPQHLELVMFRLIQECVTNIHRHSGSKTANIRIVRGQRTVTITIEDQGKGISLVRLAEIQSQGVGVGISGMRERVRQSNGSMEIESGEWGTRITFRLPVIDVA